MLNLCARGEAIADIAPHAMPATATQPAPALTSTQAPAVPHPAAVVAIDVQPEASQPPEAVSPRRPTPLFVFDPGWLFLIAGVITIAATVIIPAQHELALAEWSRQRAIAIEMHRTERLSRYGQYLQAVERGDESVLLSLAASQLNKSPIDRVPLAAAANPGVTNASVFPDLEPDAFKSPARPIINESSSMLTRWATSDKWRLWLLAGGTLCVMIGLLPPSSSRRKR